MQSRGSELGSVGLAETHVFLFCLRVPLISILNAPSCCKMISVNNDL